MISGKQATQRGGGGQPLLHGSDLGRTRRITIKVTGVREAPETFNAPIILDIAPVKGAEGRELTAWAVNKTNLKAIMAKFFPGQDDPDLERLKGKTIPLAVVPTRNPQKGEIVPSLIVEL